MFELQMVGRLSGYSETKSGDKIIRVFPEETLMEINEQEELAPVAFLVEKKSGIDLSKYGIDALVRVEGVGHCSTYSGSRRDFGKDKKFVIEKSAFKAVKIAPAK